MRYEFCVVGGGIVGLATAFAIQQKRPGAAILVLEKEEALGQHQTGHNSGVIHAGVYYTPGSHKARLCREGERLTKDFCSEHGIAFRTPGKLIVATSDIELQRLNALERNATANGIAIRRIGPDELKEKEPHVSGLGALHVEASGIVDYQEICRTIASQLSKAGAEIIRSIKVERVAEERGSVRVVAGERHWLCDKAVVCAGLQADRLARSSGLSVDFRIVPFRGEYFAVRPERQHIVTRLIYPVPDPTLPFLGIHLTPMIDGRLTVGPNAVLGFSREGYAKFSFESGDVADYVAFPGFWKAMAHNIGAGVAELKNSIWKHDYLKKCRKYCPDLTLDDLLPYRAGIRAQAISRSGEMIHDFLFVQSERVLHVCNAPSPAATSALPIGRMIFDRLEHN